MTRRDEVQVRMEIDGKQSISELGKLEMEAYEYRQELKQIKEEHTALEKESKKLDKVQERYDKLAKKIHELDEAGKSNTKTYQKTLEQFSRVSKELDSAQKATKELASSQIRYNDASDKLDQTKVKIQGVRQQLGISGMTMRQLRTYQAELNREMDSGVTKGTARYEQLKGKLQEVNGAINKQKTDVRGLDSAWARLRSEITKFGVLALGYLGAQEILGRVQNLIKGSAELSDTLSDVQKTTGLTKNSVSELSGEFGKMNTRTARKELLGMAEIAGRLGIRGKADIEGFVRAADQVNVALGDVLGDVEKVMRDMGKLTSTYNIQEAYGIEQSLIKVASSINELGMSSTASEAYIVEFTRRMGGIAPLAKISIENIMGLAATLDSLGQTSEVSTTALSKLFIAMAKNSKEFARFAKMDVADFVKLLNEDANEAFLRMLEGVKENSNGITELAASLGDLGQDGGRVVGVLGVLANNTKLLREQQTISNRAFEEGISVTNEFQLKNENLAASLAKVQRFIAQKFINSAFLGFLDNVIGKMADWVAIPLSEKMEQDRANMNLLYRQIVDVNTSSNDRIKLINEMKAIYPDLLGNINAETISNEELGKSVKRVNDLLINKIILQSQEEDIAKQNAKSAKTRKSQLDVERGLMLKMQEAVEKYNLEIEEGISLVDAATKLANEAGTKLNFWELLDSNNSASKILDDVEKLEVLIQNVKNQEGETNLLLREREDLIKRLGMASGDNKKGLDPAIQAGREAFMADNKPVIDDFVDTEALKKAKDEFDKLIKEYKNLQNSILEIEKEAEINKLDKDSQEIFKIESKFQQLREKAQEYYSKGVIDKKTYDETINAIDDLQNEQVNSKIDEQSEKIKEKRRELNAEIEFITLDDFEKEKFATAKKFDDKIALAKEHGFSTIELEKAKLDTLAQMNLDHNKKLAEDSKRTNQLRMQDEIQTKQALIDITMEYSRIAGAAIDFIGNKSGELTGFQKILALAQIGIDTGAAIMKAELVALSAASAGGPAAPFIYKATKLSVIASILTAAGRAKDLFSNSSVPTFNSSESANESQAPQQGRSSSAARKSYFFGGDTDSGGLGFGDQWGEYAGYVHKHEYVIPQSVRQEPIVKMQIEPILEALRMKKAMPSFYYGGMTTPETVINNTSPSSSAELGRLEAKFDKMIEILKNWPNAIRGEWVYTDFKKIQDEMTDLEKRYKA